MTPDLFRPGTSDANIWKNVVDLNEYRLPDRFEPDDDILDIGAHTGSFAYACIQRGAKKVTCFEPDPGNFCLLRQQLAEEISQGLVDAHPLAISGETGFRWMTFSGVVRKDSELNHGGAFLFGLNESDRGLREYIAGATFIVPVIGVYDIVMRPGNPRLVKVDAEFSEWDILPWIGAGWHQIVGEYHPHGNWNRSSVHGFLFKYMVETVPHENSDLGLFFATRK